MNRMEFGHKLMGVIMVFAIALISGCIGWDQGEESTSLITHPSTIVTTTIVQTTIAEGYPQVVEAKQVPSNESLRLWAEFKAKYGEHWQVDWNSYTDAPSRIYGAITPAGFGNVTSEETADIVANKFVTENQDLLEVRTSELRLNRAYKTGSDWSVEYQQNYKGVPVYKAYVFMVMTSDGKIDTIKNSVYPNISIATTPKLTKEQAVEIAKREINAELTEEEIAQIKDSTILMVLPKEENNTISYYLTWKVRILADRGGLDAVVFVDALNGEVVRWYSNILS